MSCKRYILKFLIILIIGQSNYYRELTSLPRAYRQRVTWGMLRLSKRSAVWKISSCGTP